MANRSKLVRDKIPTIIGPTAKFRIAFKTKEYKAALMAKLDEEVEEYKESRKAEELADILEVIRVLALKNHGLTWEGLQAIQAKKYLDRGGFEERFILELEDKE